MSPYSLSPFGRDEELWSMYKKAESSFWTVEEVDLAGDTRDWNRLTEEERSFVKRVLAFFASADILVAENALSRFAADAPEQEAKFFYTFQAAIENIHSEMYTEMITALVKDPSEQKHLLDAALREGVRRRKPV
jgi:ribonucleotide reductase beta subunit family protein with ferritin-like domain